jgi:hypothetical protein
MKLQITRIYTSDKDKQGSPLKTKDGRLYTRIAVLTKEKGDKVWISGFLSDWNRDWKVGMEVEAEVYEQNGYWNMKRPDPIKALEERVAKLEAEVFIGTTEPPEGTTEEEEDILDSIPF